MSQVENTLRSQRAAWAEIAERVLKSSLGDFPRERPSRILIFGLGSSHFAARLVAATLLRDERSHWPVVACSSMNIGYDIMPSRSDWAIALSHRGGSLRTQEALTLCERAGAFTAVICGKNAQKVPAAQSMVETVPLETVEPHTIAVSSSICALTTLLLGAKAADEWQALAARPDPDLAALRERAGHGPTILLGEREGEWLAREGALKLMEMAKVPARAFGTEEYFHGPRLCMSADERIWHVATQNDLRTEQLDPMISIPIESERPLGWVPALVELQWLALAVALNRGLDPDVR
jgi:fructoselysine-6-P-deglycase FrlB-like protein